MSDEIKPLKDVSKKAQSSLLAGIAFGNVPQFTRMSKYASHVEEMEFLIKRHRGHERLEELKHIGITTVRSYYDLIEYESEQIKRELLMKQFQ